MAWMKYWLIPVSSAESTSFRIWMTSSFPFIRLLLRCGARTRRILPEVSGAGALARGEEALEVGHASRAEAAAAGAAAGLVGRGPLVPHPPRDLLEGDLRALAARHRRWADHSRGRSGFRSGMDAARHDDDSILKS